MWWKMNFDKCMFLLVGVHLRCDILCSIGRRWLMPAASIILLYYCICEDQLFWSTRSRLTLAVFNIFCVSKFVILKITVLLCTSQMNWPMMTLYLISSDKRFVHLSLYRLNSWKTQLLSINHCLSCFACARCWLLFQCDHYAVLFVLLILRERTGICNVKGRV